MNYTNDFNTLNPQKQDKYTVLSEIFGHSEFRDGQETIIDSLLGGRDVLAVMPTGGGKSICYQIPALLSDGITLVVSPLISLMKDQVMSLVQSGVRAAYINSSLSFNQYLKVLANIRNGVYKIIYLAPERLMSDDFISAVIDVNISLVAVDEAHCVSGWGQDFRPAYLSIKNFISYLPKRPTVGAFTATATARVREDIKNLLELDSPFEITTGFDRPNLSFEVIKTKKNTKSTELLRLMRERFSDSCGIVYCGTRALVDEVAFLLNENGYNAGAYHAGMDDAARHISQEDFVNDRCNVMVATNAFGMGIDKSNVSFVIHYNMPKDVESYYQEAGRAGRDGEKAECVMLWSDSDIVLNRFLIDKSEPIEELTQDERERLHRLELTRLDKMVDYCRTIGCLRGYLLRYFGEAVEKDNCGSCSNCTGDYEIRDITEEAQKILSCIARTNNTYGATTIAAILAGSMNEQIEKKNLDAISTYGIMKGSNQKYIREIIDLLRIQGYLALDESSIYKIPTMTPKAREVLHGNDRVFMRVQDTPEKVIKKAKARISAEDVTNGGLLEQLKAERTRLARELAMPAYIIFSDTAIYDMCRLMPTTVEKFLEVSGVGKVKAEKYGEIFMEIIRKFKNQQ